MTVENLIKRLQEIVKDDPEAAKLQFIPEPRRIWRTYHLYSGFSKRFEYGHKPKVVWRFR